MQTKQTIPIPPKRVQPINPVGDTPRNKYFDESSFPQSSDRMSLTDFESQFNSQFEDSLHSQLQIDSQPNSQIDSVHTSQSQDEIVLSFPHQSTLPNDFNLFKNTNKDKGLNKGHRRNDSTKLPNTFMAGAEDEAGVKHKYVDFLNKFVRKLVLQSPQKYGRYLKQARTYSATELFQTRRNKSVEKWKNCVGKILLMNKGLQAFANLKKDIEIFGTSMVVAEKELVKKECILLPYCKFKIIWGIIQVILLLYTASFVPFKLAYLNHESLGIIIMDYSVDLLFAVDIIVNFFSAYSDRKNDTIITSKKAIALNYISSWFIFDLFVCFPFQFILESNEGHYNSLIRLLRLPRIYRLFRIVKLMNMAKNIQRQSPLVEKFLFEIVVHAGVLRFVQILFTLILFVHLFGCLWFVLAGYKNFSPNTWVARYGLLDSSVAEQYISSIYWVLQTLTTVGYGDMSASTMEEKIFALFLMIIGVGLYSFMIGSLTSVLSNIDSQEQLLISKFIGLNKYASLCNLPSELVLRMKHTLEKNHSDRQIEESSLLKEFPLPMQVEIMTIAHAKTFEKIRFLKDKDPRFILEIISNLKPISLDPNELVYCKGDAADDLYFIEEGRVQLFTQEGYIFKTLVEGSFFGEIEIMQNRKTRDFNVIVTKSSNCKLLVLRRIDFLRILRNYPCYKKELSMMVMAKLAKNAQSLEFAKRSGSRLDQHNFEIVVSRTNRMLKISQGTTCMNGYKIQSIEELSQESISIDSESEVQNTEATPLENPIRKSSTVALMSPKIQTIMHPNSLWNNFKFNGAKVDMRKNNNQALSDNEEEKGNEKEIQFKKKRKRKRKNKKNI